MSNWIALFVFITAVGFGMCLFNGSEMTGKFGGSLLISYLVFRVTLEYEKGKDYEDKR
jgi:hypothetical protein